MRAERSRQPAVLGGMFGALGGAADHVLSGELDRKRALAARAKDDPYGFAVTDAMALALTERRLLFWSYGGALFPAPRTALGAIELADVEQVEFSRSAGTLAIWLPTRTLELTVPRGHDDAGRTLALLARERIAALG